MNSSSQSQSTACPVIEDTNIGNRWMVLIFNNNTTSFDAVVQVLMRATGCNYQEASIEAWEAHTFGKASVHFDARESCERVAMIISTVGVQTEVCREWES